MSEMQIKEMSTDAKGIHHRLWKPVTVSAGCCYRYVRKHPVVSGSLVFVFFLCICFPIVFYYLACSSPIIVCTLVSIRFYLKTKHPESKWVKIKNSDKKSNVPVKRSDKPSLSVRRNARMKVLEWDRKDSDVMSRPSPTTPYDIANLFREEMKMYSPRSPYGLSTLFGNPNSDENPNSMSYEKGRNGMEHGGSSSGVEATNDRALDHVKLPSDHNSQGQSGREKMDRFSPRTPYGIANLFREERKTYSPRSPYCLSSLFSNSNSLDENPKSNSLEHGGSSSDVEATNDRALDNMKLPSGHKSQGQSEREEMDRFSPRTPYGIANLFREERKTYSPRTPYGIANLFREERKMYSPRSPYCISSLFSNSNSLDENPKSNRMEHGGSSSNIEPVNVRAPDYKNSRLSNSFQEQSGREEMSRPSPRTPYDIANLFREEMKMYSPRSPYCLSSLFSPKSGLEEKGRNDMEHGGSSSNNETANDRELDSFQGKPGRGPNGGGQVEVASVDEEDDSKKRNQRLESLIAKRRGRKLFRMAVDKSLMNTDAILPNHVPPILTAKSNLGFSNDSSEEVLQMPGSAPSLCLPKDNPFDLPYDPQEEKPNLMAESFQQEFMKDFCRHESFCRTTFLTQDSDGDHFNHYYSTHRSLVEGPTHSRFRWKSAKGGGHHHHNSSSTASDLDRFELDNSNQNKGMNSSERTMDEIKIGEKMMDIGRNEVKMETDSGNNNDSCYTSSSEDNESVSDQTSRSSGIRRDRMRNKLNLSVPPKGRPVPYDFIPSPNERPRPDFNLFCGTYRHRHLSTCSIASDLQVEVSEVGSPPLRISTSSADDGSVTYDGDADKDINSDGEEVWGSSLNLSRGEAKGEKLGELHDIIEEDSVEVDTSGLKRELEKPNASPSPSEQEAKHLMEKPIIDSKSSENRENGAQILVEAVIEKKKPAEANGPGSTQHSHGNLETLYESKTPLESKKKIEGSHPPEHIEDTRNLEPKHDTGEAPNAVQSIDNLIANNVSGSNQLFDGSSSMVLNRRLVIEQIPQNPFSSPRSVLPENVLEDEILLSDVEQPQVDLTYNMPQNAQQLEENSMDQLSGNSSLRTMEGSFNTTEKTMENAKSDDPETMAVKEKEPTNSSRKDREEKSTSNQGESQFSIGLEVMQGPENTSIPQSDSLNTIKNGEEMQNSTGHDGTIDAPTESEVKPVELEGNGSNAMAK